jgi:transcriptional regulator with XRE-family HTH domain
MDIARAIRILRVQRNISKKDMANLLNCSYSAYCRMESGEIELVHHKLSKVAGILSISMFDLLSYYKESRDSTEGITDAPALQPKELLTSHNEIIRILQEQIYTLREQLRIKDEQISRLLGSPA